MRTSGETNGRTLCVPPPPTTNKHQSRLTAEHVVKVHLAPDSELFEHVVRIRRFGPLIQRHPGDEGGRLGPRRFRVLRRILLIGEEFEVLDNLKNEITQY